MSLKSYIQSHERLKHRIHSCLVHPVKTRPRRWLRWLRPFYTTCGRGSVIYGTTRMDVVPFNVFVLGQKSVIESFTCVNNMVGAVEIGDCTRIGLHNTLIGPVKIGNNVQLAQNVVVSGMNHNYQDVSTTIMAQGVSTAPIVIEDDVWVAANSTVLSGVTIGTHSVIAAGSVVTHNIPPYSIAAGIPARVIKQYDKTLKKWVRI